MLKLLKWIIKKKIKTYDYKDNKFEFHLGYDNYSDFEYFLDNYTDIVEEIEISISEDYFRKDISSSVENDIIKKLENKKFPKLISLNLKPWNFEYTAFINCFGNITKLLNNSMYNLLYIDIEWVFKINNKLYLTKLYSINIWSEEYILGGNDISNETLNNLFLSDLPELKSLCLHLSDTYEFWYTLPEGFLNNQLFKKLNYFSLWGKFKKWEKEKLINSKIWDKLEMDEDDIINVTIK
jgi:hypothetical protein